MAEIDIAIPAYNCAAWLDDLIESTSSKTSTTGASLRAMMPLPTVLPLASWKQRLGVRMMIVDGSGRRNLGPVGNYNAILSATTSHWIVLADSDDVWRPGKMALASGPSPHGIGS